VRHLLLVLLCLSAPVRLFFNPLVSSALVDFFGPFAALLLELNLLLLLLFLVRLFAASLVSLPQFVLLLDLVYLLLQTINDLVNIDCVQQKLRKFQLWPFTPNLGHRLLLVGIVVLICINCIVLQRLRLSLLYSLRRVLLFLSAQSNRILGRPADDIANGRLGVNFLLLTLFIDGGILFDHL
jgi:hypothetical protein